MVERNDRKILQFSNKLGLPTEEYAFSVVYQYFLEILTNHYLF